MIITAKDKDSINIEIRRRPIIGINLVETVSKVISFNTETKEAELYAIYQTVNDKGIDKINTATLVTQGNTNSFITGEGEEEINSEIVTFKCHLRGFSAYNKITGEEIC